VEVESENVMSVWCLGTNTTGGRLDPEEPRNPKRGAASKEANYRIGCTRLFVEQSLEVEALKRGHLLAGERFSAERRGGKALPMRQSCCGEW
jgi:hypothetical protein